MPNEQTVQTSSEDLRKNTRDAVAILSNAITKLSDQVILVAESKDTDVKSELGKLIEAEKKRIDALEESYKKLKDVVKSEVLTEVNKSVEESKQKMQDATNSATTTIGVYEQKFAAHATSLSNKLDLEIKTLKDKLKLAFNNAADNI